MASVIPRNIFLEANDGRTRKRVCSLVITRVSVAIEVLGSTPHESEYFKI